MSGDAEPMAQINFDSHVIHWRGPWPYFFVAAPPQIAEQLQRISRAMTYGWGMIPVRPLVR